MGGASAVIPWTLCLRVIKTSSVQYRLQINWQHRCVPDQSRALGYSISQSLQNSICFRLVFMLDLEDRQFLTGVMPARTKVTLRNPLKQIRTRNVGSDRFSALSQIARFFFYFTLFGTMCPRTRFTASCDNNLTLCTGATKGMKTKNLPS